MIGMTVQFGMLASPQTDVLWAGGILIVVLILAGFVVLHIRKRWDPRQSNGNVGGELTLEQIEAMHQAGHISDEEFSAMRRLVMKIPDTKEESKSQTSQSDSIMVDPQKDDSPDT
jgi:hypothetical protein